MLEASFAIHLLQPHHRNFNKRIIKTPKLYFYDTGLACYLLGIESSNQVSTHSLRGALFETWAIAEMLKKRLHEGKRSNLYFWRDQSGNEVDVVIERGEKLIPIEIKSGRTVARDFDAALRKWVGFAGSDAGDPFVIYGGEETYDRSGTRFVSWRDLPVSGPAE